MPSTPQDTVACSCPACGNLFAVQTSSLGKQVTCPLCSSAVTAAVDAGKQKTAPETGKTLPEKNLPERKNITEADNRKAASALPPSRSFPAPQKKTDVRHPPRSGNAAPVPARNTTKIRKRREQKEAAPAIATAGSSSIPEELPEYHAASHEGVAQAGRPTWHIWLFAAGAILAALGVFMFLRGNDLESERSKILNISDRFVDHEAEFSTDADEDLLQTLRAKAEQYQQASQDRKKEDREAETVSRNITAAMNELALYCMAASDEERLHYVMDPAAIRPKMTHWSLYVRYRDFLPHEPGRSTKHGDLLQISVLMDDNTVRPAVFLYDHASKKWKLDWEAWEGYSPLLPEELKEKRPSQPVPVRTIVSMSSHYEAPFLEEPSPENYRSTSYIGFTLEFPNGERLNAYVDKYSPLALELTKLLYNGPVRACVAIHYPADLPGTRAVIIDKLLHAGWMSGATRAFLPEHN